MKNGPKIAIIVVCLLVAVGVIAYSQGWVGGAASSGGGAPTGASVPATTTPGKAGDSNTTDTGNIGGLPPTNRRR